MAKEIITLIVRIFLFIVGIALICVGNNQSNTTLLYGGITLTSLAFLFSCISGKKDK